MGAAPIKPGNQGGIGCSFFSMEGAVCPHPSAGSSDVLVGRVALSVVNTNKPNSDRQRFSWYGYHSAVSPLESGLLDRIACAGITEVRWCRDQQKDSCYQWFLYSSEALSLATWTRNGLGWQMIESFNAIERQRTEKLWVCYSKRFGAEAQTQLSGNLIELNQSFANGTFKHLKKRKQQGQVTPVVVSVRTHEAPRVALTVSDPVPLWKETVINFLNSEYPFNLKPGTEPHNVMKCFFPDYADRKVRTFLSRKNVLGVGRTYPLTGKEAKTYTVVGRTGTLELGTSTLELHRRTIRLERVAADLGRGLLQVITHQGAGTRAEGCTHSELQDLVCILRCGGGVHGTGAVFWPPISERPTLAQKLPTWSFLSGDGQQSKLLVDINWMEGNREAALNRSYIVVDDGTWAFPIITKLATAMKGSNQVSPTFTQLSDPVTTMLEIRASIIHQERVYLLRYGSSLTDYCRIAQHLFTKLSSEPVPSYMKVAHLDDSGAYARLPGDDSALPIDCSFHGQPLASLVDVRNATTRRKKQVSRLPVLGLQIVF